jgi:hypothetical protein
MASVTEVRRAETKENGHGTAVSALVLQQIGAVFRAHLGAGHVAAPAAHQFGRVVIGAAHVQLASSLASVIGLRREILTFKNRSAGSILQQRVVKTHQ